MCLVPCLDQGLLFAFFICNFLFPILAVAEHIPLKAGLFGFSAVFHAWYGAGTDIKQPHLEPVLIMKTFVQTKHMREVAKKGRCPVETAFLPQG